MPQEALQPSQHTTPSILIIPNLGKETQPEKWGKWKEVASTDEILCIKQTKIVIQNMENQDGNVTDCKVKTNTKKSGLHTVMWSRSWWQMQDDHDFTQKNI